ncbi:hypothetical protein AtNW77_Chr1g0049381 [Arabidopsis thaliana]|uniref:Uncharacterized protein n=2 Tax=Arabidopsis thaliana TaxID=3702 RepID=A0A178W5E0_ARATH|nr:hypothetical protein AXX17_AT1G44320 [Arabidopsis thaliana]BAE99872.1 hypothetical protein [Arabidopsis thaliana]
MSRSICHQPCVSFDQSRALCIWFYRNTEIYFQEETTLFSCDFSQQANESFIGI